MKKLTYEQKLAKRNFKRPSPFWYFIYHFVMSYFVSKKYNCEYKITDDINKCKGPAFLIFNHLSRLDHCFAMTAAWPRRLNILAGYVEFFRSHLYWVFKKNQILPKKNMTVDVQGMKNIIKIINKGGTIAFAPEGLSSNYGTNQPIIPGTGHLLKYFKIPVYFLELHGAYLLNHKTSLDERYGKVTAEMKLLFTPEQLESMSEEEIEDKINTVFRHDEYEWQKERHIKWENKGTLLNRYEDFCFKCPKCGAMFELEGVGDNLVCNHCGNGATMDDYYEFHPYNKDCVIPESMSKWVAWERQEIIKDIRNDPKYFYEEEVEIGTIPDYELIKNQDTSLKCGKGKLRIDHDGVHFVGTKFGEPFSFDLNYKQIYTIITEKDSSYFNFFVKGKYYDFFPLEHHSTGYIMLLIEEMHRLHVNTWKNFKWNDYMYENLEDTKK